MAKDSCLPFICLTDDPALTSETWEIRRIVPAFPADPVRSARLAKLLAHQFLPEFEGSLYIDNSVHLLKPPEALIEAEWQEGGMALPGHSFRETLDGEFDAVLSNRLDDLDRVLEQRAHYYEIAPEILNGPVFWSAIMLRDHRARAVQRAMEVWAWHVARYSRRDQLSLPTALHLAELEPKRLEWDNHASPYHSWPHIPARKLDVRIWNGVSRTEWKERAEALAGWKEQAEALAEALAEWKEQAESLAGWKERAEALSASTSWRVTAPLRALATKFPVLASKFKALRRAR